jgi:FG-GAP-like repeat
MRPAPLACLAVSMAAAASAAQAAEWRVQQIDAPARVFGLQTVDGQVRINAGGLWYRVVLDGGKVSLQFIDAPAKPKLPEGALPDGHVAIGKGDITRAWLAEPTTRYDHGILGDKNEAGSLIIETSDSKRHVVRLGADAVFEDLEPRIVDLDGNGRDEIVVVKSYLKSGSCLAVIGERKGKYEILAETPPLGAPHRWLDPAGIADFNGDGKTDIALVREPHVVGALELWTWSGGALHKSAELSDVANHIAGSRQIDMSAVADFDGDNIADIAVPSFDRSRLRIVSFAPEAREIASVPLPAKAATNLGLVRSNAALPAIALGLADGTLALIQKTP